MKERNPRVTLDDETQTYGGEEKNNGFLDSFYEFNVTGDDGELYEDEERKGERLITF